MSKTRGKNIVTGNIQHVGGHVVIGDGVTIVQGNNERPPIDYLRDLPPLPPDLSYPPEPYIGLRWFTRTEALVFFGRGDKIKELHDRLSGAQAPPVTLLYGQSGVGKSSLLHAGLLPRLEGVYSVHYLRRDYELGMHMAVQRVLETDPQDGKSRLFILDQLEELLTQPNPAHPSEAVALAQLIAQTEGVRWLLSFRKEYLAEITELLRGVAVAPQFAYLEPMQHRHIIEAVEGVSRHEASQKIYGLTIEPAVAEAIAHDIARDQDSHIAPALQVLLTKLWQVATGAVSADSSLQKVVAELRQRGLEPSRSQPRFTSAHYAALIAESGLLMDEFLGEQLKLVARTNSSWAENGGILSVLRYFTTELGTARARTHAELTADFGHLAELPQLLTALQDRYLLTDQGGEKSTQTLRLAHDALGPLLRRRFDRSAAAGPKALNILENRLLNTADPTTAPLDKFDLAIVLDGRDGMRAWNEPERQLVEVSQRWRRRNQWLGRAAIAVIGLLLIAASVFGFQNYRSVIARNRQLHEDRGDNLSSDPTQQLLTYYQSIQGKGAAEPDRVDKFYTTYRNEPIYTTLLSTPEVYRAAISADARELILINKSGEAQRSERFRFDPDTKTITLANELDDVLHADQAVVRISADGRTVASGGNDHELHLWDLSGRRQPTDTLSGALSISTLDLSADGRYAVMGFLGQTFLQYSDGRDQRLLAQIELDRQPTVVLLLPEKAGIVVGFADGAVTHLSLEGRLLSTILTLRGRISALTWHEGRQLLAVGTDAGQLGWSERTADGWLFSSPQELITAAAIRQIQFDVAGNFLAVGQADGSSAIYRTDGSAWRQLRGLTTPILAMAFVPSQEALLTVSESEGVRYWYLPDRAPELRLSLAGADCVVSRGEDPSEGLLLGSYGSNIQQWLLNGGEPTPFAGAMHEGARITALTAAADRLVSGDEFGRVLFHDRRNGGSVGTLQPVHRETIRSLYLTDDGRYALSASADTRLVRWDADSGDTLATVWSAPYTDVALSPNGRHLAVLDNTGGVSILGGADWRTATATFPIGGSGTLSAVGFLSDEVLLVGGDRGYGCYRITGDSLYWFTGPAVRRVVRNRNLESPGPRMAIATEGNSVLLLDVRGHAYQWVTSYGSPTSLWLEGAGLYLTTQRGVERWRVDRLLPEQFVTEVLGKNIN